MKNLLIKLGLWEAKTKEIIMDTLDSHVLVDAGWYEIAMKHYCGTCKQWFKTASVAVHNRFKHPNA